MLLIILWGIQFTQLSNPIADTPITVFSELVFDSNNNWTMEIYFPFGYRPTIDSIVFKVSGIESKLKIRYPDITSIGVITSDSLTIPLTINRNGDKIVIFTYSTISYLLFIVAYLSNSFKSSAPLLIAYSITST